MTNIDYNTVAPYYIKLFIILQCHLKPFLCFYAIYIPKYMHFSTEHMSTPLIPYPLGVGKEGICGVLISDSC